MFKKFFKFLYGYVIIEICGSGAERFLNICLRRGIRIWDTVPLKNGIGASVLRQDFRLLRGIVKKCRVKVKIKEKHGLLHMIRLYRHRHVLLITLAVCAALCIVSTRFIWLVEINGVENSDIAGITETLDKMGVRSGALKSRLPEGMDLKRAIISENEHIAWAWVYIEGAKARVEIYEQTIPPTVIDKDVPCDIVAACDGSIKRMIVKNGEEVMTVGDAVNVGDVIVSGKVPTYKEGQEEEYIYVHSMAEVDAYTSHKRTGDYKLYYESRTPTGKHRRRRSIEVLGKVYTFPMREVAYEDYDVSEKRSELNIPFFGYSGIALDTISYDEVTVNKEPISIETAVEFAKNDLEEKLSKELRTGSRLQSEDIEYVQTDNETISVTLEMNFIENIAAEQPLSDG